MVDFEAMLHGDVWDVVCDVHEWCLLQCFAITERSKMGLCDVSMFMYLYGFGIGMMFASFHV